MGERLGEFERIDRYFKPLAARWPGALGLADDAALLDVPAHRRLVVTTDTMVESVHYLEGTPADAVARKLLRVNLSDLAAMGAEAKAYTLSLALPRTLDTDWLAAFAEGLAADQERYGIGLIGGDSVSTPGPPIVTATLFGEVDRGRALLRGGGREGDTVWVSGRPGEAVIGLEVARGELPGLAAEHRAALKARYDLPEPRLALGQGLVGIASAALDVSDGLVADLGHLCRASRLGAIVEAARLPRSPALAAALEAAPELEATAIAAGDDYELVFTAPPSAAEAVRQAGETAGVPVTAIGCLVAGEGVQVRGADGRPLDGVGGWTHF